MLKAEFFDALFKTYSLVNVLSEKNNCRVLHVRNKMAEKDMVVRYFPKEVTAYEELYRIDCKHLPLIYDVINLKDGQIVLEEFIEGITVAQVMESGKYNYLGAKRIIYAVSKALNILHERNIVHRDIKPENVMIDKNGRVVLIDFNTSKKTSKASKDTVIMGTVGYAAPEQLGLRESLPQTDIYALGIMLNVMITGKHPTERIAKGKAGKIVRKCTNVNPEERYNNIESLIAAL